MVNDRNNELTNVKVLTNSTFHILSIPNPVNFIIEHGILDVNLEICKPIKTLIHTL